MLAENGSNHQADTCVTLSAGRFPSSIKRLDCQVPTLFLLAGLAALVPVQAKGAVKSLALL
jgi:hypothetical protein